jgi:hypothetical protein
MELPWRDAFKNLALKEHVLNEERRTDPSASALSRSLKRLGLLKSDFQQAKCWDGFRLVQGDRVQRNTAPQLAIAMATFLEDPDTSLKTIHAQVYRTCVGSLPSKALTQAEIQQWFKDHEPHLARIEKLDFSGLGLREVSKEFCNVPLPNLHSLSFRGNQLKDFPPGFGSEKWPKLKNLDASENQNLCAEGWDLCQRQLERLSLRGNGLLGLPWNYGRRWSALTALDLTGNKLDRGPDTTFWPNMRELKLDPGVPAHDSPAVIERDRVRAAEIESYQRAFLGGQSMADFVKEVEAATARNYAVLEEAKGH